MCRPELRSDGLKAERSKKIHRQLQLLELKTYIGGVRHKNFSGFNQPQVLQSCYVAELCHLLADKTQTQRFSTTILTQQSSASLSAMLPTGVS